VSLKDVIKINRISDGLTQEELGKIVGYSRRTVCDWENGKTEPDANAMRNLCKALKISADELLEVDN